MILKIQPLMLGKEFSEFWGEAPVMAAEAWVRGPVQIGKKLREKEVPSTDVSLENLQDRGVVEVYKKKKIERPEELEGIPEDVDAFFLYLSPFAPSEVLEKLVSMRKPILGAWDSWGFSWHGRLSDLRSEKYSEAKFYWPFGIDDVTEILGALKAWKRIKTMKVVYIGDIPSHSVREGDRPFDFDYLHKCFGTEFVHLSLSDYQEAVEKIDDSDATELAEEWKREYDILDEREGKLKFYSKIYLGLKKLLKEHNAISITMDCAWLPDVEYVPCFAFSKLIDEGIAAVCEGDMLALFMMNVMQEISEGPVTMGNLNENATHSDIEANIVEIDHDVVPPSMGCPKCKLKLRDFHATKKGLTPYVDLEKGRSVTLAGIHWDMNKMWAAIGNIQWSKDTIFCREAVGIKVDNARGISKNAFPHHIVMTYGDHRNSLEKLADLLGMKYISF